MSKICQITGKKMMVGNNVSHSKRRTKRTFQPNLFDKKFYLEEENRYVSLRVSAQAIRTINKNGLKATLDDAVKKGKGNRVQVILECTEHKESGMPGTSRYISTKNRKNSPDRLELKKYNPVLRKVTVHREIK
jgi:ribosomal protein L28/ribosomal protein L33